MSSGYYFNKAVRCIQKALREKLAIISDHNIDTTFVTIGGTDDDLLPRAFKGEKIIWNVTFQIEQHRKPAAGAGGLM